MDARITIFQNTYDYKSYLLHYEKFYNIINYLKEQQIEHEFRYGDEPGAYLPHSLFLPSEDAVILKLKFEL